MKCLVDSVLENKKEMITMYEIIVVGGGHAGCEAAYACAYKGHKTFNSSIV